ncbi:CatB-related O-acetyltransferase [Kineococcus sp. G2]|uniref:CatB-related O-acetyltransferase n=1 Tax=Kineococcus sp. G2 TaxID=3127484 RepID=UPI00301C750B
MSFSVLLLADTILESVAASVRALADAIDVAEASGVELDVVVLNASPRDDVARFLAGVEGASVIHAPGAGRPEALRAGVQATNGDWLWIGGTESAPSSNAIATLLSSAARSGRASFASPADPAPYAVVAGASARTLVESLPDEPVDDPVRRLIHAAIQHAGTAPAHVSEAGVLRVEARRTTRDFGATVAGPGTVLVGPATYSARGTLALTYEPLEQIEIGGYCSIANEVRILLPNGRWYGPDGEELDVAPRGRHRMDAASTFPMGILVPDEPYDEPASDTRGERLRIADDVWVGYGATILGQVNVGPGSIIGARSLVLRDVPPYTVVGGVPARELRRRFADDVIERLLAIRWWEWPEDVVRGAHDWFRGPVEGFIRHFDVSMDASGASGTVSVDDSQDDGSTH